ncbi:MAG: diacylglycerol/polyprenol kinase family protein [Methanobacterium sp.]
MEKELFRQLIHASGVFVVILSYFLKTEILIIICIGIVIFMELLFRINKNHHVLFFSDILKRSKRRDDERGFAYFFIGIILTLIFFHSNINVANAAILLLVFGDSASNLVGRNFGKIKLPLQEKKTLEGTLAFVVVGFLFALTQVTFYPAILGALSGAIIEAYSPIDDNIPIPLLSGLIMSLIIYLM